MHIRVCFLDFSLIPTDVLFCSRADFSVPKGLHQCFLFCKKLGFGSYWSTICKHQMA